MPKYGSATWPQSKNCSPGALQHLLPKPTNICVIQLASRDRIPLLGNTWPTLTHTRYPACVGLAFLYEYVCMLNHIPAGVRMCVWHFMFAGWHILSMIKGDSATCCDCQVLYYRNMEIASALSLCWQCSCVCVCVLANCISANFISIQRGFGLSQVLRHSVEGRKNTCQNIFTLSLIASKPVGCNLTNDF